MLQKVSKKSQIFFDGSVVNPYSVHRMNTQASQSSDKERQLTLELLQAIDQKDDISQRHLAQEMGVALGLANSYLKRCVKKGLIKIKTAPANRYLYYLTPNGFAEKARLTGEFLSTSLALFRQSGDVYSRVFEDCLDKSWQRLVLVGVSDLTEIAYMRSLQSEVQIQSVFQPGHEKPQFFDLPVVESLPEFDECDAFVMTSMEQTSNLLEVVHDHAEKFQLSDERIIVPSMILNMQYRTDVN